MKKIFIALGLLLIAFSLNSSAQKTRKISEMISDSQKTNSLLAGLLGGDSNDSANVELTMLSAINYPNSVRVKYLDETQKLSKTRKKAVDKWLKDYAKTPAEKKFYANDLAVEQDGVRYWIIAHETAVVEKLKASAKKGDEVVLKMKILGYAKKGTTTDYFLLADGVE